MYFTCAHRRKTSRRGGCASHVLSVRLVPQYTGLQVQSLSEALLAALMPVHLNTEQCAGYTPWLSCILHCLCRYICVLQYTRPDGSPLPGAPTTMMYLL
jgi:hypothetical protein